jgi:hypothetical protein
MVSRLRERAANSAQQGGCDTPESRCDLRVFTELSDAQARSTDCMISEDARMTTVPLSARAP